MLDLLYKGFRKTYEEVQNRINDLDGWLDFIYCDNAGLDVRCWYCKYVKDQPVEAPKEFEDKDDFNKAIPGLLTTLMSPLLYRMSKAEPARDQGRNPAHSA